MKIRPAKAQSIRSVDRVGDLDPGVYRQLVDSVTDRAVFAVSLDGVIASWNAGAQAVFGYGAEEIVGQPFDVIFTAQDVARGAPAAELANARGDRVRRDGWFVRKNGSQFWATNSVGPLRDGAGALVGFATSVHSRPEPDAAPEESRDGDLRRIVACARDYAIFRLAADGTIRTWSAGARAMFGYAAAEIVGLPVSRLFCHTEQQGGVPAAELRCMALNGSSESEHWFERADGSLFFARGDAYKLEPESGAEPCGFAYILRDVTERVTAETELRRRAQYDALTDLPNRRTFFEHLERAISFMRRRSANRFAVLFVDIDRFKELNDEVGHVAADALLAVIARRLEKARRAEDIVARVGGDEFAILLNGVQGISDAEDVARRIIGEMHKAVRLDTGEVFASLSIGIAMGSPNYARPEDILRDADAAMYVAKSAGRGRAIVFDATVDGIVRVNSDLAVALRQAIARDELRALYAPVVRLSDMTTVGFEALVRWQHPRRGLLLPAEFLPVAEESNAIVAIDRWLLMEACVALARWQPERSAGQALYVSVNVSGLELTRDDFDADIRRTLDASGLPASSLRLEIAERSLTECSAHATMLLASIRSRGVSIDVANYGSGTQALGGLNHIFVDGLKIDPSLIGDLGTSGAWERIESGIAVAHEHGLVAIAAGVETAQDVRRLVALGCDFAQGRYFAAPLTAAHAAAFLRGAHQPR